jgi:cytochrome c peroxidase
VKAGMNSRLKLISTAVKFVIALVLAAMVQRCQDANPVTERIELEIPLGLEAGSVYIPEDNPLTREKIELGRKLFFDKRLSADNTVACADCHSPFLGFTDGMAVASGINEQKGERSSPTIINRLFSEKQFWDGRAGSLEKQVLGPIQNPIEMANTLDNVVRTVNADFPYRKEFRRVFGTEVTIDGIAKAIASFERTLISGNSLFDQFKQGDKNALSESAQRGFTLFESGRVNCIACHSGPNFTNEEFKNNGAGMDTEEPDLGRYTVTKSDSDRGAFKTPTLRDIVRTAPYMHDGSLRTLLDVIDFYNKGGIPNKHLSKEIRPLNLTGQEKADLVEFLKSLGGRNTWSFL